MKNRIEHLENESSWNTNDLRKLFERISKNEGYYPYRLKIVDSKIGTKPHGLASINGGYVRMIMPTKQYELETVYYKGVELNRATGGTEDLKEISGDLMVKIAQIYVHELGHNLGLDHKDMISWATINVDYVKDLVIRKKTTTTKEIRVKLKNFHYKGYIATIHRYPKRVEQVLHSSSGRVQINDGYWYSLLIHNKITRARIYRKLRKFYKNTGEVQKDIKKIVNKRINK